MHRLFLFVAPPKKLKELVNNMWTSPDLDVFYASGEPPTNAVPWNVFVLNEIEPSGVHSHLHRAIVQSLDHTNEAKPIAKIMSKFFPDPTINTYPESDPIGATVYHLGGSNNLYIHFPRWRRLVAEDPTQEWIFTYPVIRSLCLWMMDIGVVSVQTLSCLSLQDYVINIEQPFTTLEEGVVRTLVHGKEGVEGEEFLLPPLDYLLPHIWNTMTGNEGLSVVVGSAGISERNELAVRALANYLANIARFSPNLTHLSEWIDEYQEEHRSVSEGFITKADNPPNNGVMFG